MTLQLSYSFVVDAGLEYVSGSWVSQVDALPGIQQWRIQSLSSIVSSALACVGSISRWVTYHGRCACLTPAKQFELRITHYPTKVDIWFQYDPPVLIVAATLHGKKHSFCRTLYEHLSVVYEISPESVSLAGGYCTGILLTPI